MHSTRAAALGCVAAAVVLVLLQSCAMFHRHGVPAVVGTWKNTAGTTWVIRPNGSYDVELTGDKRPDIRGKYTVAENEITLTRTEGLLPRSCREKAVYRYERAANSLRFTVVTDGCNMRKKQMALPWRLVEE